MEKPEIRLRVILDTVALFLALVVLVAGLLWAAWLVDFGIDRQDLVRVIAVMILVGFALFTVLFLVLVVTERSNHYTGERTSRLQPPMIVSTGALMVYFGLASIQAVDVYYKPQQMWPLMRDPTVQLITASLILVIVSAKAWLLWEILPHRDWKWRRKSP